MGTNFYWMLPVLKEIILPHGAVLHLHDSVDVDDPCIHIGKRSAAGRYCWDCDVTLCKGGVARVHHGDEGWHTHCPKCGKAADAAQEPRAALVELGFQQPRAARPTGVGSCSSFSWAQDPARVRQACEGHPYLDEPIIRDEYDRKLTGREFLQMLVCNCPIEYTDMIGRVFF